jgi:NADH dehydrogenase
VRALVRTPDAGAAVFDQLPPGQRRREAIEIHVGDVTVRATLAPAMTGVDAVVHLVAIPRDSDGGATLRLVNTEGTRNVVVAVAEAGIRRLIHLSAMGVEDDAELHFASSRAKAEAVVRASRLHWTVLKPSIQFGPGDGFFNIIADLVRWSPGLVPVPGRGDSRFQPIHVADVAGIVVACLADPATIGGTYELGGPRYWTYRAITAEVVRALGAHRLIVPMPVPLIRLVAEAAEVVGLPFPVATDQLRQLRLENIGPLNVIPETFAFTPRDLSGALGYLRLRRRDQRVEPNGWPVGAAA